MAGEADETHIDISRMTVGPLRTVQHDVRTRAAKNNPHPRNCTILLPQPDGVTTHLWVFETASFRRARLRRTGLS